MRRNLVRAVAICVFAGNAQALYHEGYVDANRWWMPLANNGTFAVSYSHGYDCTWRSRSHTYFYNGGPWIGVVKNGDTLVSVACNPNNPHAFDTSPGDSLGGEFDSLVLVYVYPRNWPPPASRFPEAPQFRRADQDAWMSFNDLDSSQQYPPAPHRPIGIQFTQSTYLWGDQLAQDFVYHRYTFENQSGDTLYNVYFGIALDPDLGDATDDMCGVFYHRWFRLGEHESLYVDNLAYAFDATNSEPGWDTVGVVGASLIKSPGRHTVSALKKWTLEVDPLYDPEQYLALAGYDWRSHAYAPIDSVDTVPGDKRMLIAMGPFNLLPQQEDSAVLVVLGVATWPDTAALVRALHVADSIYRNRPSGVASWPDERLRMVSGPTFIHGTLSLSDAIRAAVLLDASGRTVARLRPGANDVRALAPGVYFVRTAQAQAQAQALRKVVLTK